MHKPFYDTFETLEKGKKDAIKMYKPEHPGFAEAKTHTDWAYSKMPNENWSLWTVRAHRDNPSQFTPEVKSQIEHYAGMQHFPEVANVRFDKSHTLESGLGLLKEAEGAAQDRVSKEIRHAPKPIGATKLVDFDDGYAWWDLDRGSCHDEGKAMGHCGNVPSEKEGDIIHSLRKEYKIGSKTYYEPHATFIYNDGIYGEMKGRNNQKPAPHYLDKIHALFMHTGGLPFGGGYAPENNFSSEDFSEEQKKALADKHPVYNRLTSDAPIRKEEFHGMTSRQQLHFLQHHNIEHQVEMDLLYGADLYNPEVQALIKNPNISHKTIRAVFDGLDSPDAQLKEKSGQMAYEFARRQKLPVDLQKKALSTPFDTAFLAYNPNIDPAIEDSILQSPATDLDRFDSLLANRNLSKRARGKVVDMLEPDQDRGVLDLIARKADYRRDLREALISKLREPSILFDVEKHGAIRNLLSSVESEDDKLALIEKYKNQRKALLSLAFGWGTPAVQKVLLSHLPDHAGFMVNSYRDIIPEVGIAAVLSGIRPKALDGVTDKWDATDAQKYFDGVTNSQTEGVGQFFETNPSAIIHRLPLATLLKYKDAPNRRVIEAIARHPDLTDEIARPLIPSMSEPELQRILIHNDLSEETKKKAQDSLDEIYLKRLNTILSSSMSRPQDLDDLNGSSRRLNITDEHIDKLMARKKADDSWKKYSYHLEYFLVGALRNPNLSVPKRQAIQKMLFEEAAANRTEPRDQVTKWNPQNPNVTELDEMADFLRRSESDFVRVASVAIFSDDGLVLFGKRNDNQKWSLVGGHIEDGESPAQAIVREMWEESGLIPNELEFIGKDTVKENNVEVYAFRCKAIEGEPTAEHDPDEEFETFRWVDPNDLPQDMLDALHNPKDIVLDKLQNVKKSIGGMILAGIMSTGMVSPALKVKNLTQYAHAPTMSYEGLHKDLYPIAQLESSGGKNTKHAANSAGAFHTAFGTLGFKPSTAHEEWRKSPDLQKQYPNLKDPADFLKAFTTNTKMYNTLASHHFARLVQKHGSPEEAARSWRYGSGAVLNKHPSAVADKEGYVKKYKELKNAK